VFVGKCDEDLKNRRAGQAKDVIHPVLGRCHTNQSEASHHVLTIFRSRSCHLQCLHYHLSTGLVLLQGNMTCMPSIHGLNNNGLHELLQRMGLSVLCVEAVLKQANMKRFES